MIVDSIAGIDKCTLMRHHGFTDGKLECSIHYDIKYRMGKEAGEEE